MMKPDETSSLRQAAAEDLRLLAFLHSAELDAKSLSELRAHPFGERFAIRPEDRDSLTSLELIENGWAELRGDDKEILDELAADYAAIYLTYRLRAAPSESPWRDEDNLQRQEPMFEVRRWYERFGYQASDWRERPDDHLVLQLQFTARLLEDLSADLEEARNFLSSHLLEWLEPFCKRVAERCATSFYRGLAGLTLARVNGIMNMITCITEQTAPRNEPEARPETA